MQDKGHCKMLHEGEALAEYADFYDYSSSYPDQQEQNADEDVSIPILDGSDFQLVLPSGATIGHRSLMRYYRLVLYLISSFYIAFTLL
jgi:pre-60S factor REI1